MSLSAPCDEDDDDYCDEFCVTVYGDLLDKKEYFIQLAAIMCNMGGHGWNRTYFGWRCSA